MQGRIKRFITARVLDVARKLAPVTDLDAKQLAQTLMPTVDFTTVEEMETFFAQEFAPKVVAALKAKDVIGGRIGHLVKVILYPPLSLLIANR